MKYLFLTFFTTIAFVCSAQSTDVMPEWSFTAGIEGPATDDKGYIYAVSFEREGTIGRVDPRTGKGEIFVDLRALVSDSATANGIRFSPSDRCLYVAEYKGHNLLKIDLQSREVSVVAHDAGMYQPNDLALAPSGDIYLSDPDWKNENGQLWLYRAGKLKLIAAQIGTANGIEVSPDGRTLYVGLSAQRKIIKYMINEDGTISDSMLFATFDSAGLDGMRCDVRGNLYVARYDDSKVVVFDANGKQLREVELKGKKPSNLTFSGCDVYVTMADRGCLETFRAKYKGRE